MGFPLFLALLEKSLTSLAPSATSFPRRAAPQPRQFVICFYAHHKTKQLLGPSVPGSSISGRRRRELPGFLCLCHGAAPKDRAQVQAPLTLVSMRRFSQLPLFRICGSPECGTSTQITAFSAAMKFFTDLFNTVLGVFVPSLLALVEGPVPTPQTPGQGTSGRRLGP